MLTANGQTRSRIVAAATQKPEPYFTDLQNAQRFVDTHGSDFRYSFQIGKWLAWTGECWELDGGDRVERAAREIVKTNARRFATSPKELARFESVNHVRAIIYLARSGAGMPVRVSDLDRNPFLFATKSGTLDLTTGKLRDHKRSDLITKLAPVEFNPKAKCPLWERFLDDIFPDAELREFVQRAVGYSLSGDVSEQLLFVGHGTGANGKSTFLKTVMAVLGPHSKQAAPGLFLKRTYEGHPTRLADLCQTRFVASVEIEEGKILDETLVKQVTGGDKISARFMRRDFFSFDPTWKVWILSNHLPRVRSGGHAIWRRIRLIPFTVTIPTESQDRKLDEKLRNEFPGILNWALGGCLQWQREGLGIPDAVKLATSRYRQDEDEIGGFLSDCCIQDSTAKVAKADLFTAYDMWCRRNGREPHTKNGLGRRLSARGLEAKQDGQTRTHVWLGWKLATG